MDRNQCRLCLNDSNLSPIFMDMEQSESYTNVLELTTGLKINPNDGLPQLICTGCSDFVNTALNFRNQCQLAETKLLQSGYARKNKNIDKDNLKNEERNENIDLSNESIADCNDFHGLKVEVELERLSEDGAHLKSEEAKDTNEQPKTKSKNMSVKEKRAIYMNLVEGKVDTKGPVKCKICQKTVSKWACFINHAKKHLGFKFVCEYCGKSFISSTQLKRHSRSYHGLEKEIKCNHCDYLAMDNAQLVVHERRMHTGERPYVCDMCAASYFSRKCLIQHIENHRPTADIQCDACPQLLKSARHLAKHRYSAHGDKRRLRRRQRRTIAD